MFVSFENLVFELNFSYLPVSVASLHCELIWVIRFSVATFEAPYCDMVALYLDFNTIRSSCLFFSYFLALYSDSMGLF
jgi:hypothetical protein